MCRMRISKSQISHILVWTACLDRGDDGQEQRLVWRKVTFSSSFLQIEKMDVPEIIGEDDLDPGRRQIWKVQNSKSKVI